MKTKKLILSFAVFLILFFGKEFAAQTFSIIPQPNKVIFSEGKFLLNEKTVLQIEPNNDELTKLASLINVQIESIIGKKLEVKSANGSNSIKLILDSEVTHNEGYSILIGKENVVIKAKTGAGLFYGIQSFLQMLPLEKKELVDLPCCTIEDSPRFGWRGVHLDVCRHFFPIEFVKKYIDILAVYKINTFHWHLTEDQGWRIEIKAYPKLTEVGAWRKETMGDGKPHGGFYTQDQIREVVNYASSKYITVVPEIEMPGHAVAALASYPEYSCTGGPFDVETKWGVFEDVYCAGNDKTFEFLENILNEVLELFPSKIIHIGGDEVPKTRWQKCEKCQARIKAENLKDEHELQSYFIQRIEKFLNSKGRMIIGWDEILEGGLAENAAVMSWRGVLGGIAAAKMNHYVVMSPGTHCYFDHYQGLSGEPKAIGGFTPLEKVYSYEPVPSELTLDESKYILGAQANMWAEYYETTDHVEYMLLPRLCALAEVVWTEKENKNYDNFLQRMKYHYDFFIKAGYNFRVPTPTNLNNEVLLTDKEKILLSAPINNAKIFYTINGTDPTVESNLYLAPLEFSEPILLKTKTFLPNGKSSPTVSLQISFIDTTENGLYYKYFEGDWEKLPKFWELRPDATGKIRKLSLSEIPRREDFFGLDIYGFIEIDKEGDYTFYLSSDDGSKLFINNKLVIDNDGMHANREVTGKVYLEKGKLPFKIFYFDKTGSNELRVQYEGPGVNKRPLPANKLFFNNF